MIFVFWLLMALTIHAEETVIEIPNGSFEAGLTSWVIPEDEGMSSLSDAQAASGKLSLMVNDTSSTYGSAVMASRLPVLGAGVVDVRGKYYAVSGSGLGIYVRLYNKDGQRIGDEGHRGSLGGSQKEWRAFSFLCYTTEETAFIELYVHSYNAARVHGFLDDLHFVWKEWDGKLPWGGQYKIRADETDRLTPADVVGPDGLVYPNWTQVGVLGGIPPVATVCHIEQFGGKPDDGLDDSEALRKACIAAGQRKGGAVLLDAGVYHLDHPVTVRDHDVVIRGAGMDQTRIVFRYAISDRGIAFYHPQPNARIGLNTRLELHALPTDLERMTLSLNDEVFGVWSRGQHSGNTFAYARYGRDIPDAVADGAHTLKGVATYRGGMTRRVEIPVILDRSYRDTFLVADSQNAIAFRGQGYDGDKVLLIQDGKRGDTTLVVQDAGAFAVGDPVVIDGPATKRWKDLTQNACEWGVYRRYMTRVTSVTGNTIGLAQPLRIDFPIIDGSSVRKFAPIYGGGVENLTLEQTENLWITGVGFINAWGCWARNVRVNKCGRNPVYADMAKWCEIRDCVFDDAWFKGGGGTAYVGWDLTWDCLMDGVTTYKMRHAPLFQWAASGCVIRNSTFYDSDAQWHSGWTHENLIENCVVTSTTRDNGGYGYGMWASPPEDRAHGPNGPRNVVYNNDITSLRAGVWMGGMNEGWMILHNRFVVEKGPGIFAKTVSFDHTIRNNMFVLKDPSSPLMFLATPDCIGIDVVGNTLYGGNGRIVSGSGKTQILRDNQAQTLQMVTPERPKLSVESIYMWQNRHKN